MTALRTINCAEATERAAFFVLGALDTREALEVREHLETCSRAHEEFAEIGGVVPHLAELPDEVEPSAELRQRLLDSVDADVRARRREYDAAERLVASFGARPRTARPESEESAPVALGPGLPVGPGLPAAPDIVAADRAAAEPAETAPAGAPTDATGRAGETRAEGIPAQGIPEANATDLPGPSAALMAAESAQVAAESAQVAAESAQLSAAPASATPTTAVPTTAQPISAPIEAARADALERGRGERRRRPVMAWLVAVAAVLAVVALGGWNMLLQAQVAEERDHLQALQGTLAARNQPNAIVAVLAGTDAAPGVTGTAVMPPGRPGYLIVQGLPAAPAGKTYQAWYVSGKESRPAGLLKVGGDGIAVLSGLNPPGPIDAMAVTLEQEGGVERTSQQPLVYGKVSR